jgi:spermidine synthase
MVKEHETYYEVQDNPAFIAGAEGVYTRLTYRGQVIMTDTPGEMQDHEEVLLRARGSVLITGLGLGMLLGSILEKPEVTTVTVIEKAQEVIDLVGSHYIDPRLRIIRDDAFLYKPDRIHDVVWHDIWSDIFIANLLDMERLRKQYRPFARWQGFWAQKECEQYADPVFREEENVRRLNLVLEDWRKWRTEKEKMPV